MHRRLKAVRWAMAVAVLAAVAATALGVAFAAAPVKHAPTSAATYSCATTTPDRVTTAPDPRLAASLAILRRPATPADTPAAAALHTAFPVRGLHVDAARLLRDHAWIVPADDVRPQPLSAACVAHAPADRRAALQRQRARYAAGPARPGTVIVADAQVDVGPSVAPLTAILAGQAIETASCAGPSHDMLGLYALLPDGAAQPYLRFADGHTVLGEPRDNAVTFLINKPDQAAQLPTALAWTDAAGAPHATPLQRGALSLEHCAALPTHVRSQPVTGQGTIEAVAHGETPDATLDRLAVEVHQKPGGPCPTIGLTTPGAPTTLAEHVVTYCVGHARAQRFVAAAERAQRLGDRALLIGYADPQQVRWIEVETTGSAFLVRPSRSGAFFVAYPDGQPGGRRWRVRAALQGPAPIRFTAYRTIVLGPTKAGAVPAGASPTINPNLLAHFAVLRRPRTARDALPHTRGGEIFHQGDANPQLSRSLGRNGTTRFFAVPGQHDLCLVQRDANGSGSVGCGPAATNARATTPAGGSSIYHGGVLAYAFLPDGIDHVTVERNDGRRFTVAVRDSLASVRSTVGLHRLWWTAPGGKVVSLPGLSHSGLGTAAPTKTTKNADTQGRQIALQATRDTAGAPACTPRPPTAQPVLSDAAPLPEITRTLPALATAAPAADTRRAAALLTPNALQAPVLRRTLRTIAAGSDVRLLVYVQQGSAGARPPADPAACGAARRTRAIALTHDRGTAIRAAALHRLAQLTDTIPGLQTLWVMAHRTGEASTGGGGLPIAPGHPLTPGLATASGSALHRVYAGIADPRARHLRTTLAHGAPKDSRIVDGLFAVVLPRGTGAARLRETDARGATVRTLTLRP